MIQPPKRVKYRKVQKGRLRGKFSNPKVHLGDFGLQSLAHGYITPRQIESARRVMTRYLKREGKIFIRIFPDKPITKKPLEVRQGKGKGNVEYYVYPSKPGAILFEISGVKRDAAAEAFRLASAKLPISVKMILREGLEIDHAN
ncbi:MAG: 50S ribosomal protein L16 [Legionellales bacterium]|nr:50S ribosomal protein L16 [Legionellales bacterium]|tara:strand:- start:2941 stop:3372 length:432 start_codon:yes stop_codon:yes gene_type:complete